MKHNERTPLSLERLDLIAVRGPQIAQAYAARSSVIASIVPLVTRTAATYVQTRERMRSRKQECDAHVAQCHAATVALHQHVLSVQGALRRDVSSFPFDGDPPRVAVPESVFMRAERVILCLEGSGDDLPYAAPILELLIPTLKDAKQAYWAADADRSAVQDLGREQRKHARALFEALLTLRGPLKVLIGRDHRDYELLMVGAPRREETPETNAA